MTLLDIQHPSRDSVMPVPELVVLGPYDLGVDFGHPDVPRSKQKTTGKEVNRKRHISLLFQQRYKKKQISFSMRQHKASFYEIQHTPIYGVFCLSVL